MKEKLQKFVSFVKQSAPGGVYISLMVAQLFWPLFGIWIHWVCITGFFVVTFLTHNVILCSSEFVPFFTYWGYYLSSWAVTSKIVQWLKSNVLIPYVFSVQTGWYFITLLVCPVFQDFTPFGIRNLSFYEPFSISLIILTSVLVPICMYLGRNYKYYNIYCWLFAAIHLFLTICFLTDNLLLFYVSFEAVTALMFVVVLFWGYEQRRSLASFYFFYFTFFSSLFFLAGISALYWFYGSVSWYDLMNTEAPRDLQLFVWWCFAFAFAVKIPMYPFHIWLPEAHVEAPTGGSILLAAVLLKLGFYGFYKFLIPLFFLISLKNSSFIIILALISITHAMLVASRQIDAKRVVAYCSIAHMNLGVIALFTFTFEGLLGSTTGMIAHGFISAGLFFLIGSLYKRYGTRSLNYYGGTSKYAPLFSVCFFFMIIGNIAFPLTLNFVTEFQMLISIITVSFLLAIFTVLGIVMNTVASLSLFIKTCYGSWKTFYAGKFSDLSRFEFTVSFLLIFVTFYFGVHTRTLNIVFDYSFLEFFKPLTNFVYNSVFVEALEIPRPYKNLTSEELNELKGNYGIYDFINHRVTLSADEIVSPLQSVMDAFYIWVHTQLSGGSASIKEAVRILKLDVINYHLIQLSDSYHVSANCISIMEKNNIHSSAYYFAEKELVEQGKNVEERCKMFWKELEKFNSKPLVYDTSSIAYNLAVEYFFRLSEAYKDLCNSANPPTGKTTPAYREFLKKILLKDDQTFTDFGKKNSIVFLSLVQNEIFSSLQPHKYHLMSIFMDKFSRASLSFSSYNSFSSRVSHSLEVALRYPKMPEPSNVLIRDHGWPHEFNTYDIGLCYDYSSNILYCQKNFSSTQQYSAETFFWYAGHKPVLAAIYESLSFCYDLASDSLKMEIRDVLISIVTRNQYPSQEFLAKVAKELNLPSDHIITLVSKEGYPKLPDFDVAAWDSHFLIKQQLRYKEGFPYHYHLVKKGFYKLKNLLYNFFKW